MSFFKFKTNFIFFFLLINKFVSSTLLFVIEHFRHGARGPCNHLDQNGNDFLNIHWDTLGELSPIGMRMHYILGYRNRLKYSNFLSSTFDPRELYLISTDVNRTIQSLYTHLNGLYPPSTGPNLTVNQIPSALPPNDIDDNLKEVIDQLGIFTLPNNMNTFPIHIFHPSEHLFLLHEENNDCEPIKKIREKNRQKKSILKTAKEFNKNFGEELLAFLNKPRDSDILTNFTYINIFCDHYISDYTEGRDLSILKSFGIKLGELEEGCHNVLEAAQYEIVFGDEKDEVVFMSMTPPMKMIFHWMERRIQLEKEGRNNFLEYASPRFVILSGHDNTVAGMELFMSKTFNNRIINPKYAANLYFELHKKEYDLKDDLTDYFVKYYMNDELIDIITYDRFKSKVHKKLWSDQEIKQFCNFKFILRNQSKEDLFFNIIISLSAILGVLIFVLIGAFIYIYKSHMRNRKKFLRKIPSENHTLQEEQKNEIEFQTQ